MDNIETILYLVIGVGYLISRVLKARKKAAPPRPGQAPPPQPQAQAPQNQRQPKKSFSFEDILKEFEQSLEGEVEAEEPPPVREVRQQATQPVADPPQPSQPSRYEAYEGTSFNRPMSTSSQENYEGSFARNENYSIKEELVSDYVKMLQEPDGFKNAIVLSEIINRKYF